MNRPSIATAAGILILLFQVFMIIYARFDPMRYFCWAPFDAQNRYRLTRVVVNGRELSDRQILDRYQMPRRGLDQRAIEHLFDRIRQREQTYGKDDQVDLEMSYDINGGAEQTWFYKQP